MYELIIKTHFSAAHKLNNYYGKCENLHGHNWAIEVILSGKKPDKTGLIIDFRDAKKIIAKTIDSFDHKYLNDLKDFKKNNPTTENIARILYKQLTPPFKKYKVSVRKVGVWESPECGAYYSEGN